MRKTNGEAQMKTRFQPSFWVANGMELFERLAYYGQATILSVFLRDHLRFDEVEAGQLSSIFGGLIYFLPIFAGALADKFGFKKAFSFAFFILAIGYFLIGSTGIAAFAGWYSDSNLFVILSFILIFTAIGGAFIKPSVLGTVALTTTSESKSLGYAIYYWLVNMGAAMGPLLAYLVRDSIGIEFVYLVSALSCGLMFLVTLFFFKEPQAKLDEQRDSLLQVIKNLWTVVKNIKFMIFLLIFALYWIVFWEFFIVIPFYISDYISPEAPIELILSVGAWTIILLQLPINRLTKNIPTPTAIMIGFIFAALSWFLLYLFINSRSDGWARINYRHHLSLFSRRANTGSKILRISCQSRTKGTSCFVPGFCLSASCYCMDPGRNFRRLGLSYLWEKRSWATRNGVSNYRCRGNYCSHYDAYLQCLYEKESIGFIKRIAPMTGNSMLSFFKWIFLF